MKGLYEGGQCNPNAVGATSNQYKRMMNAMTMGGQNPERVMQQSQQGQNFQQQIMARQAMFKQMNQGWQGSQKQMEALNKQMQMMMRGQFDQAQQQHRHEMMMREMQWQNAQQHMMMQQKMMQQQFEQAKMMQNAEMWKNEMKMDKAFEEAQISKEAEQASIMNSSGSMLEVMMNDPDPRFQNSQFLHFLKRIQNKEVVIEGKQIKEMKPDQIAMEKAWNEAQKTYEANEKKMQGDFKASQEKYMGESQKNNMTYEQHWQQKLEDFQKQYQDHQNFEKMLEEKYAEVLKEMNLDLTNAWQSATDLEEELVHGQIRQKYVFQQNNPYLEAPDKKLIALDFINRGINNEAILALEAQVQKEPEDSESWRILGRILQENDQDQKSITCFMNSIKYNPQNLDSLLSLGVSCTNILDEVKAMNFLKKWIILNPKYKHLNVDPNIIPDGQTNFYTYKIDDIKKMNVDLIGVFEQALLSGPKNDPELFNALAILYFLKRQYDTAINLFQNALQLDPTNYLLMNKIGAAMAHLGRADQAIKLYHSALDVRPNYVRVWVNLGIAHGFKGDYEEAARFYLNALSFRPDAKHIWSYLHNTFMNMHRYDLIKNIADQNPRGFPEFDIIDLKELPEPEIPYKISTQRHILNKEATVWLKELPKK